MSVDRDLKYILLSILFVFASFNLTRTTLAILKSSKRLDTIKTDITAMKDEQQELEKSIAYKKSDAYVEQMARDELNMAKPAEEVLVVKGIATVETQEPTVLSGVSVLSASRLTIERRVKNVKAWVLYFQSKLL